MTGARADVYAVLVLLTELDRTLHPHTAGGDSGGYGVEQVVPPPLPPTGLPGAPPGPVALTAQEWQARGRDVLGPATGRAGPGAPDPRAHGRPVARADPPGSGERVAAGRAAAVAGRAAAAQRPAGRAPSSSSKPGGADSAVSAVSARPRAREAGSLPGPGDVAVPDAGAASAPGLRHGRVPSPGRLASDGPGVAPGTGSATAGWATAGWATAGWATAGSAGGARDGVDAGERGGLDAASRTAALRDSLDPARPDAARPSESLAAGEHGVATRADVVRREPTLDPGARVPPPTSGVGSIRRDQARPGGRDAARPRGARRDPAPTARYDRRRPGDRPGLPPRRESTGRRPDTRRGPGGRAPALPVIDLAVRLSEPVDAPGPEAVDAAATAAAPAARRRPPGVGAVRAGAVQAGRQPLALTARQVVRLRRAVTTSYLDRVLRRGP